MPASRPASIPEADSGNRRTALVLSGGGAKGAYEIGVMRALFEGNSPGVGWQPLAPEIYTGTSIGSYNATYMVAHGSGRDDLDVLQALEQTWKQRIASSLPWRDNGVYRIRGNPGNLVSAILSGDPLAPVAELLSDARVLGALFARNVAGALLSHRAWWAQMLHSLDISAFFDMHPMHYLLNDTLDLGGLRRCRKRLFVATTDFEHGLPRIFSKEEMISRYGWKPVAASAAIPGLFPEVQINGVAFVDGGVTMNTPLAPAIIYGATEIHVVFLQPRVSDLLFIPNASTFNTLYRLLTLQMSLNIFNQAMTIGTLVQKVNELKGKGFKGVDILRQVGASFISWLESGPSDLGSLVIHKYFPSRDLGGGMGLLNFRSERIERLIRRGYMDARAHNCAQSGCIGVSHNPLKSKARTRRSEEKAHLSGDQPVTATPGIPQYAS